MKGAIVGLLVGVAMNAWVFTGALDYSWYIEQFQGFLPLRTDMCPMTETSLPSNATTPLSSLSTAMSTHQSSTTGTVPAVVEIYSMSFWYLSAWGFTFTIVVGLLTSFVTCTYFPGIVNKVAFFILSSRNVPNSSYAL
ncbi:unnamed protein product [Clavelina lepadiformis]|uniref:Uncharacterized protein n=1 Tax=Clavelina lepadiformis TaxID=159417 RepID=A0ABP0GRK7_CLALP